MSPTDVEEAIVWVVMNTDSAPKSAKDDSLEADTEHLNRIYSKKDFIFFFGAAGHRLTARLPHRGAESGSWWQIKEVKSWSLRAHSHGPKRSRARLARA